MTAAELFRNEGRQEGQINTLLRQIQYKFGGAIPSSYLSRVNHAGASQLESWIERILVAESVNELFEDEKTN